MELALQAPAQGEATKEKQPLTPAQQELYDWLVARLQKDGRCPSIRDMMRAMGLKSPAPVQSRLAHLQAKGWVDWTPGRAKTLVLTGVPTYGELREELEQARGAIAQLEERAEQLEARLWQLLPDGEQVDEGVVEVAA